ncbi:hypothetical protein M8C17_00315 [Micromonospora sp. RHAY321]|uniref:hypothetical protein n=1 Tax=Micromonospora sp. RHAY321 TaxID=2944807 RepID=UPI00207D4712|nr:hypothetical protein [Micromonospora sp. RHAY321]MCO1593609.1 hypothetical protein [Micromonospora sp. RHAY321]
MEMTDRQPETTERPIQRKLRFERWLRRRANAGPSAVAPATTSASRSSAPATSSRGRSKTTSVITQHRRFGDPPTPVPETVAELLLALGDQRTNMHTAINRDAGWLFHGRRAGQPLTTRTIALFSRDLGIPTVPSRLAALRQLVLQAPAPVIAQALGSPHHPTAPHRRWWHWNRYAADDS